MNIKDYIETLLEGTGTTILEISKTGSQLFKEDPNDLDYTIVCENFTEKRAKYCADIDGVHYDFFMYDKEALLARLDFNNPAYNLVKIYNYFQEIREVVYGNFETNWDLLDCKQAYLNHLQIKNEGMPSGYTANRDYVHFYVVLKMFENNSTTITEDMKEAVDNLYHEIEDYTDSIDWVREQLNK
jgi:hypothetical protein